MSSNSTPSPTTGQSDRHSFIKMIAVGKTGGQLLTYSDRFSFSGMTGKGILSDAVKAAVKDIDTTTGPPTVDTTTDGTNPAEPDPVDGDVYKVDYAMQTGLTRYAPMQPVPPTKITAKNTKPLYPTSSVKIAKTRLPIPSQLTTLTQSQTFSVKSMENTVRYLGCIEMRSCSSTIWHLY